MNKFQHSFTIKTLSKVRGELSQLDKEYLQNTHSKHQIQWQVTNVFHLRSGTRQVCPFSPLTLIQCHTVNPSKCNIKQENEIKDIQFGGRKTLSFTDDMTVSVENLNK